MQSGEGACIGRVWGYTGDVAGFGVWGLGFRVCGLGRRIGFRVWGYRRDVGLAECRDDAPEGEE
jgi:hypothetical protein